MIVKFWQEWKMYVLGLFTSAREPYHVGWLKTVNVDVIEENLIRDGWQPNYFSFGDKGQVTSMRKMYISPEGYWKQYHTRVFIDGEICGHNELAYEENAIAHEQGIGTTELPQNIKDDILNVLGEQYESNI
jgi:hypothetical protein